MHMERNAAINPWKVRALLKPHRRAPRRFPVSVLLSGLS
jgi:hypothetical protein